MHKRAMWFLLFMMAISLLIAFEPWLEGRMQDSRMEDAVETFHRQYVHDTSSPDDSIAEMLETEEKPHMDLLLAMQEYNKTIFLEKQINLSDQDSYQKSCFDLTEYGMEGNVFGVIKIPVMGVEMPIYLGASEENLMLGACVLGQTSIPIGGENTNAVIAGHRGWNGSGYFVNIDRLKIGDELSIENPWEVLQYRVSEIRIIAPDDVEQIHIQEEKDLITLLTCHPYRSGGKQRYLVICDRGQKETEEIYD